MSGPSAKNQVVVWTGLAAVILAIAVAYLKSAFREQPWPVDPKTPVSSPVAADPANSNSVPRVYFDVPDFSLTNQLNQTIGLRDLRGQVWICDVIFTRCPTQCPLMTRLMARLQKALPGDLPVRLVSLTADPEHDQPDELRKYGAKFGADESRWWFLTGEKAAINHLAASGLKFVVADKKPSDRESEKDLFIHTTKMVLVDKAGRIRGWYSSEDADSAEKIVAAARQLAGETPNSGEPSR